MASEDGVEDDVVCIEITHVFTITPQVEHKWETRRGSGAPQLGPKKAPNTAISCVDFEHITRRLYVGCESSQVFFWTLKSLEYGAGERKVVGNHKGPVTAIHVMKARDGKTGSGLLVTGSADASLRLWDPTEAGRSSAQCLLQTLVGHGGTITDVSRTQDYILSSSVDKTFRVWRAAPGRDQALYPWYEPLGVVVETEGWVHSMTFARSNQPTDLGLVYVADEYGSIIQVDIDAIIEEEYHSVEKYTFSINGRFTEGGGPPVAFRRVHERSITKVVFLALIHRVACLSYDNTLVVFNAYTGLLERTVDNPNNCHFTGMVYEVKHNQLVLVDSSGYMSIYSFDKGEIVVVKRIVESSIIDILAKDNTTHYAIILKDRVEYWNIDHEIEYAVVPGGHHGPVISLYAIKGGLSPHREDFRVFSAGLDNTIRLWDPYDMACIRVLEEEESELASMTFFESLGLVATGHDDGHVRVWNLDLCSTLNMKRHTNTVSCLTVCQIDIGGGVLGERLTSCSFDGTVAVWEVRREGDIKPHLIKRWDAHGGAEVLSLLYDPLKHVILTAGNDHLIKVWSNSGFQLLGEHVGHKGAVTCMALDANFLFSGSEDHDIKMWDTVPRGFKGRLFRSGTHLRTLKGHTQAVTGLDVMPLSGHLASCSADCSIRLWNYTTGAVLLKYTHHEEFKCLALRADTDEIVVGTEQCNILRFPAHEEVGTITAKKALEAAMDAQGLGVAPLGSASS